MFTVAGMSEQVSENTYNHQWTWGLCGFLFPLEKEIQVQPMDEVMLHIKYTAGQPIEHVMIDLTLKGETIRNIL